MLMNIIHQLPVQNDWLTMKLGLVLVYLALGFAAFGGEFSRTTRFPAGYGPRCFGFIYSVAHPRAGLRRYRIAASQPSV